MENNLAQHFIDKYYKKLPIENIIKHVAMLKYMTPEEICEYIYTIKEEEVCKESIYKQILKMLSDKIIYFDHGNLQWYFPPENEPGVFVLYYCDNDYGKVFETVGRFLANMWLFGYKSEEQLKDLIYPLLELMSHKDIEYLKSLNIEIYFNEEAKRRLDYSKNFECVVYDRGSDTLVTYL
jgi:hypothetical protein